MLIIFDHRIQRIFNLQFTIWIIAMDKTRLLTQKQIDYCMECGLCTGSCPISRELSTFSPRQIIKRAMLDPDGGLVRSREIWACLSCASCSARCPAEIDFPEFINPHRQQARQAENFPRESHHGILQAIAGLQTHNLKQQRNRVGSKGRDISRHRGIFLFCGVSAFFRCDLPLSEFVSAGNRPQHAHAAQ